MNSEQDLDFLAKNTEQSPVNEGAVPDVLRFPDDEIPY